MKANLLKLYVILIGLIEVTWASTYTPKHERAGEIFDSYKDASHFYSMRSAVYKTWVVRLGEVHNIHDNVNSTACFSFTFNIIPAMPYTTSHQIQIRFVFHIRSTPTPLIVKRAYSICWIVNIHIPFHIQCISVWFSDIRIFTSRYILLYIIHHELNAENVSRIRELVGKVFFGCGLNFNWIC